MLRLNVRFLEIDLHDNDRNQLISEVNAMCEKLLANTVIEDYKIIGSQ